MSSTILDPIVHSFQSYAPIDQQVMNVSQWFATETMEVEVGDTVGRPSQQVKLSRDVVTYLLANGWYITAYMESAEGGEWTSTARATVVSASGSTSSSGATAKTNFTSESTGNQYGDGETEGRTQGESSGESSSSGSTSNSGSSVTENENGGAPYWYSCFKVRLQRRRIQAENVLQDMVRSFTDAYNEGRKVNSDRYDEIVSLYALMLASTESEANAAPIIDVDPSDFAELNSQIRDAARERLIVAAGILDGLAAEDLQKVREQLALAIGDFKAMYDEAKDAIGDAQKLTMDDFKEMYDAAKDAIGGVKVITAQDIKDIIDAARTSIRNALAKFAESVDGLPEGWLESRTADINRKFDALLSSAAADLVTKGIYNSTTWPTTQSGIERDRAYALNNLVDEIARIKVDVYGKIATITADVEARALDAPLKLADIERSLAELETFVLTTGMKLADIQSGFANIELKVNDAGVRLAEVERGLAGIELNIADEKLKFADGNVGIAKADAALADIERNLVDSEIRIADALHKQTIGLTELRNSVLKWMLDFMERRDDEHPSLDALVNVSEKLGYAEGAPASNISN